MTNTPNGRIAESIYKNPISNAINALVQFTTFTSEIAFLAGSVCEIIVVMVFTSTSRRIFTISSTF